MIVDFLFDYQLRGRIFEHVARILVRRRNGNNFIFVCSAFDSIDEIIAKYRLDCCRFEGVVRFLSRNGLKSDLIEFVLDDSVGRVVSAINFYDVKSRLYNSVRDYSEMCISNFEFLCDAEKMGCGAFVAPITIFRNWRFDLSVEKFKGFHLRVYDSQEKKTLFFT